ncbi:MAG TPA: superoxide dismutase family protein [Bacilli bacterium]
MKKIGWLLVACISMVAAGGGCSAKEALAPIKAASAPDAVANLLDQSGKQIGTATLRQTAKGVSIVLQASGLRPGLHAFHVHEKGVCDPPDFKSAGEHFNPFHRKHGTDNPQGFHAGDLPNVEVKADGTLHAEIITPNVTLAKDKINSLLQAGGTALMLHEKPDDYFTDPAGDAGKRIACGVVKPAR